MSDTYRGLLNEELMHSPILCQGAVLDMVVASSNGEFEIMDATNPVYMLAEASCNLAVGAMEKSESLARRSYPDLALEWNDLYPHLSTEDYRDRWAKPDNVNIVLAFSVFEINQHAVIDPVTQLPTIVIPPNTEITASGLSFYIHYPIIIQVVDGNDLIIRRDISYNTPLLDITTNQLEWQYATIENVRQVHIVVPTQQLKMESVSTPISPTSILNTEIGFSDEFYHVRAWSRSSGGDWKEILAIHDPVVYDSNMPTVVIEVQDNLLRAYMPELYYNNGTSGSEIRLDIYTTKGAVGSALNTLEPSEYLQRWTDVNQKYTKYAEVLPLLNSVMAYSLDTMSGGGSGITFEQMKEKAKNGLRGKTTSVTDLELATKLNTLGYTVNQQKKTLTGRVYLAGKTLLPDGTLDTSSGIGVGNTELIYNPARTDLDGIVHVTGSIHTISPDALYREVDGAIELMGSLVSESIRGLSLTALSDALNSEQYYYSPFHYVLDGSETVFDSRAYSLDRPSKGIHSYLFNNTEIGYVVNTDDIQVSLQGTTYVFDVVAAIPDSLSGLGLQVAFLDGSERRTILATPGIVGSGLASFKFEIDSKLDIDRLNTFLSTNWLDTNGNSAPTRIPLDLSIELTYVVETTMRGSTAFDNKIVFNTIPYACTGVSHETLSFELGKHMDSMFTRPRTIIQEAVYETHAEDVPMVYQDTRIARDPVTDKIIYTTSDEGNLSVVYDYKAGDPVLDDEGNPRILHFKGDTKVIDGVPIEMVEKDISYETRLTLFDAKYLFSSTAAAIAYREKVVTDLIVYLEEVRDVKDGLIEETDIYFEPTITTRSALARVSSDLTSLIRTDLSFKVNVLMTRSGIINSRLRTSTESAVKDILRSEVSGSVASITSILSKLESLKTQMVLDISISADAPGDGYLSLEDKSAVFSVATKVIPLTNGSLDIIDDVDFVFDEFS